MFNPNKYDPGRSSGLSLFLMPSHFKNLKKWLGFKNKIELTATGIAPDLHRIPFSFRLEEENIFKSKHQNLMQIYNFLVYNTSFGY
jgi:hypothetical protein